MAEPEKSNALHALWVELEHFTDTQVGLDECGLPCAECPICGAIGSAGKRVSARLQRISNTPPPSDSRRFCPLKQRPLAEKQSAS